MINKEFYETDRRQSNDPPQDKIETAGSTTYSVTSEALLNGHKELVIEHAGELYRLRITSKGKLILTK